MNSRNSSGSVVKGLDVQYKAPGSNSGKSFFLTLYMHLFLPAVNVLLYLYPTIYSCFGLCFITL